MYQALDKDTFDNLVEMTDFQKFKEAMLAKKRAIGMDQNAKQTGEVNTTGKMSLDDFKKIYSEDVYDETSGWKKLCDFENQEKGVKGVLY